MYQEFQRIDMLSSYSKAPHFLRKHPDFLVFIYCFASKLPTNISLVLTFFPSD